MREGPGELYARALAAYRDGDAALCASLALATLDQAPRHGAARLLRAVTLPDTALAAAAASYSAACQDAALDPDTWFNRGVFLERIGRVAEAMDCYRRTLALDPVHRGALINGTQLIRIHEHFDEALRLARRLKQLTPDDAGPYTHEAICLQHLGRLEEADALFDEAVARSSDPSLILWEHHFSLLARQQFAQAWDSYEVRFLCAAANGVDDMEFDRPRWTGAADAHVLVYGEQGLGDQLMFASALPDLLGEVAHVSLAVAPPLVALFAASFPSVAVYSATNRVDPAEVAALLSRVEADRPVNAVLPIGSLMARYRPSRETFPGGAYLGPSDTARAFWRGRDVAAPQSGQAKPPLRVGLCWASNPAPERFHSSRRAVHKTMPLDTMAVLAALPGVSAVAVTNVPLDRFDGSDMARRYIADVSADFTDLDRTAALLETLDLLITVDTGVAHLAGALGVPVWVCLHSAGDARWGLPGAPGSYWYDSARLFWQATAGDWPSLISEVGDALSALVATPEAQ